MSKDLNGQKELIDDAVERLNKKVDALRCLQKSNKKENRTAISIFDELLGWFYQLLWESVVVDISLLFDERAYTKKDKKDRSLFWYVDVLEVSSQSVNQKRQALLDEARGLSKEYKKFRRIRDKWLVHKERASIENFDEFWQGELPSIEEVELFRSIANKIIQLDIEKIDATPSIGIGRLFTLISVLENECPDFTRIVGKYGFASRI